MRSPAVIQIDLEKLRHVYVELWAEPFVLGSHEEAPRVAPPCKSVEPQRMAFPLTEGAEHEGPLNRWLAGRPASTHTAQRIEFAQSRAWCPVPPHLKQRSCAPSTLPSNLGHRAPRCPGLRHLKHTAFRFGGKTTRALTQPTVTLPASRRTDTTAAGTDANSRTVAVVRSLRPEDAPKLRR